MPKKKKKEGDTIKTAVAVKEEVGRTLNHAVDKVYSVWSSFFEGLKSLQDNK